MAIVKGTTNQIKLIINIRNINTLKGFSLINNNVIPFQPTNIQPNNLLTFLTQQQISNQNSPIVIVYPNNLIKNVNKNPSTAQKIFKIKQTNSKQ